MKTTFLLLTLFTCFSLSFAQKLNLEDVRGATCYGRRGRSLVYELKNLNTRFNAVELHKNGEALLVLSLDSSSPNMLVFDIHKSYSDSLNYDQLILTDQYSNKMEILVTNNNGNELNLAQAVSLTSKCFAFYEND